MLINLSNHPSAKWSEPQHEAAIAQYASISDLQFPAVPSTASPTDIYAMAVALSADCVAMLADAPQPSAVMIAGEQTLLYKTVQLLKLQHITCVSASSERKVVQISTTEKSIKFSFVQFREF